MKKHRKYQKRRKRREWVERGNKREERNITQRQRDTSF